MTIIKGFFRIVWLVTRYFLVCGLITLATMSITTGKFPPPVKDIYKSMGQLQSTYSSVNLAESTANIAKARETQKQVFAMLDNVDSGNAPPPNLHQIQDTDPVANESGKRETASAGVNTVTDKERIKALEYEVAYLKAKLARAEWETRQAIARQAPPKTQ
jgi:hypothetical protein